MFLGKKVYILILVNLLFYRMQEIAKELGIVLPVSFFEEANNAHYNSIAIIDADGTDLGLYRKSHIPDGPGTSFTYFIPLKKKIIRRISSLKALCCFFIQDTKKSTILTLVTLVSR